MAPSTMRSFDNLHLVAQNGEMVGAPSGSDRYLQIMYHVGISLRVRHQHSSDITR